jgi:hypothetical protein
MITLQDIREGSTVIVRGGFGLESPAKVRVDYVYEEIKNNHPGIDYIDANGSLRWAYLDQVVRVVEY